MAAAGAGACAAGDGLGEAAGLAAAPGDAAGLVTAPGEAGGEAADAGFGASVAFAAGGALVGAGGADGAQLTTSIAVSDSRHNAGNRIRPKVTLLSTSRDTIR